MKTITTVLGVITACAFPVVLISVHDIRWAAWCGFISLMCRLDLIAHALRSRSLSPSGEPTHE